MQGTSIIDTCWTNNSQLCENFEVITNVAFKKHRPILTTMRSKAIGRKSIQFELGEIPKYISDKEKLMSVEELATMYHIPGSSVITPNLSRVETTRKEAPSNLPIGN